MKVATALLQLPEFALVSTLPQTRNCMTSSLWFIQQRQHYHHPRHWPSRSVTIFAAESSTTTTGSTPTTILPSLMTIPKLEIEPPLLNVPFLLNVNEEETATHTTAHTHTVNTPAHTTTPTTNKAKATMHDTNKKKKNGMRMIELRIWPHAPLGCVIEESLCEFEEETAEDDIEDSDSDVASIMETATTAPSSSLDQRVRQRPRNRPIFVSRVTPGGNADRAGVRVGDVLLQCSDSWSGEMVDVTRRSSSLLFHNGDRSSSSTGSSRSSSDRSSRADHPNGVDAIKRQVQAHDPSVPLLWNLWRGTNIQVRHDQALVELCRLEFESETAQKNHNSHDEQHQSQWSACLQALHMLGEGDLNDHRGGKETEKVHLKEEEDEDDNDDADDNHLVDHLIDLWAHDEDWRGTSMAPGEPPLRGNTAQPFPASSSSSSSLPPANANNKVKPWSSRSSPSGTYVLDPATGKLVNLDA